jgi:cytochrome c553
MPTFTVTRGKTMRKTSLWALSLLLAAGMAGCGKKESAHQAENASAGNTPQIKVTQGAVKIQKESKKSEANSGQFYYSYNKEKKSNFENPPKKRTTIDAYLHIHSPYERIQINLMIKKLSKDFIVRCSPCHDDYANGVIGPSLLGKSGDFIYGRLMDFKSGKRKNVLMKELVSQIDDKKLRAIADEIAAFNQQIQKLREGRK